MTIDALILRSMPWREHDIRVVLYTRELGKCAAVARGARRASSRQGPALDAGTRIRCQLIQGRGGWVLTGAQCMRSWSGAQTSPFRLVASAFFLEASNVLIYDAQPDEALWQCLTSALEAMDACSDDRSSEEFRYWQGALFATLGYGSATTSLQDAYHQLAERPFVSLALLRHMALDPIV